MIGRRMEESRKKLLGILAILVVVVLMGFSLYRYHQAVKTESALLKQDVRTYVDGVQEEAARQCLLRTSDFLLPERVAELHEEIKSTAEREDPVYDEVMHNMIKEARRRHLEMWIEEHRAEVSEGVALSPQEGMIEWEGKWITVHEDAHHPEVRHSSFQEAEKIFFTLLEARQTAGHLENASLEGIRHKREKFLGLRQELDLLLGEG